MNYKTIFIDAPTTKSKSVWGSSLQEVNGDQLARDVDAAVIEKEREGYELFSTVPITASKVFMGSYTYSYTSGLVLVFKKKDT